MSQTKHNCLLKKKKRNIPVFEKYESYLKEFNITPTKSSNLKDSIYDSFEFDTNKIEEIRIKDIINSSYSKYYESCIWIPPHNTNNRIMMFISVLFISLIIPPIILTIYSDNKKTENKIIELTIINKNGEYTSKEKEDQNPY